mgnify:FL=1
MTKIMRSFMSEQWDRGLAVGQSDIRNDAIDFRFKDERFTFPALEVFDLCKQNGTFYTVKVKKLRALRNKHG